jgi:hypothetical protein
MFIGTNINISFIYSYTVVLTATLVTYINVNVPFIVQTNVCWIASVWVTMLVFLRCSFDIRITKTVHEIIVCHLVLQLLIFCRRK